MTLAPEIAEFADQLLRTGEITDYPGALNGLQVGNDSPIVRVAAAVDFSSRAIEGANAAGANLLVVHHGVFWGGNKPFVGVRHRRMRALFSNDIAIYSSHLPLDLHREIGNNVLLAAELGLEPTGDFAQHESAAIGVAGTANMKVGELINAASEFSKQYGGHVHHTLVDRTRAVGKWGMCSGAGADVGTMREAIAGDVETLIVGEGPHWAAVEAEENGIAVIFLGHYASETLGVQALAKKISERFGIPWEFIFAPTGT